MYADEQNLKARHAAGLAGIQENSNYPNSIVEAVQGTARSFENKGVKVPLCEQLEKQFFSQQEGHAKLARAIDILGRHPEFEELIELQDIIRNRIY